MEKKTILALTAILDKLFNFYKPQFLHVLNRSHNFYLLELVWRVNERAYSGQELEFDRFS